MRYNVANDRAYTHVGRYLLLLVCFWWMHHISARQDAMLKELHGMTVRIEKLSQIEHDLIRDVHPQVGEIKEKVEDVADAISAESANAKRSPK